MMDCYLNKCGVDVSSDSIWLNLKPNWRLLWAQCFRFRVYGRWAFYWPNVLYNRKVWKVSALLTQSGYRRLCFIMREEMFISGNRKANPYHVTVELCAVVCLTPLQRRSRVLRVDRDSVVGIASTLRTGRSGDRIPVGTRFSAPVQTGPGAQPAFYTVGNGSLSRG
jgi:hypothetical protein